MACSLGPNNMTTCNLCLNSYFNNGISCEPCPYSTQTVGNETTTIRYCSNCTSANNCFGCIYGYYLLANNCSACSAHCQTCSTSTSCQTCFAGYYLDGEQCQACSHLTANCLTCQ